MQFFFNIVCHIPHKIFVVKGSHIAKDTFNFTAVSIVTTCLIFHRKRHQQIISTDFVAQNTTVMKFSFDGSCVIN